MSAYLDRDLTIHCRHIRSTAGDHGPLPSHGEGVLMDITVKTHGTHATYQCLKTLLLNQSLAPCCSIQSTHNKLPIYLCNSPQSTQNYLDQVCSDSSSTFQFE
jgi:hypothetical protein